MSKNGRMFYSKDENILFNVYGYSSHIVNAIDFADFLKEEAKKLAKLCDGKWFEITKSSRYKYMTVFYIKGKICPDSDDIFVIGNTKHKWTMMEWLTY